MADIFAVSSDNGVGINVDATKDNGDTVYNYGRDLEKLLKDFEGTIDILQKNGMQGEMVEKAVASYNQIKDSLSDYATSLQNTGLAITESAENLGAANQAASENISVFA